MKQFLVVVISTAALASISILPSHAAPADIISIGRASTPTSPQPQPSSPVMQVQFQGQEQNMVGIVTRQIGKVTIQVVGIIHIPTRTVQEGQIQVSIPLPGT